MRNALADTIRGVLRYTAYTWDAPQPHRHGEGWPDADADAWQYTYDRRGLRSTLTKPNGTVATHSYHEDGLLRAQVEKTSAPTVPSWCRRTR